MVRISAVVLIVVGCSVSVQAETPPLSPAWDSPETQWAVGHSAFEEAGVTPQATSPYAGGNKPVGETIQQTGFAAEVFDTAANSGIWFASFESTFLRPHFDRNVAYSVDDGPGNPDYDQEVRFNWSMEYAPRFNFGWIGGGGTGLLVSYF